MRSLARCIVPLLAGAASLVGAARPAAAHTFDLASHMPPHLAIMFSMSWFGVPTTDPQGGLDPSYGNWAYSAAACGISSDPDACADFADAGKQRNVGSNRRPLAGIYSASARDATGGARVDLMLSMLRRPCDDGARLDAWSPQLDSIRFTSAYPSNKQSPTWDYAYRATLAFLEHADAAGMQGKVALGVDSTVYWHFGAAYGLTTPAEYTAALTSDIADMAKLVAAHPSALALGGRPLLAFYVDPATMTVAEWETALDAARASSGVDFYALGTTLDAAYFGAFDALVPWVNLGLWASATGATTRARAAAWQKSEHDGLVSGVGTYPGRVVFGSVTPGFDDFTQDWGQCMPREIPRDDDLLRGEFDYFATLQQEGKSVSGLFLQTWDDWTEGTEFEPDVVGGTEKLVLYRQLAGTLFGDPVDPAGDQRVDDRWHAFGQPYDCCFAGGVCSDAGVPVTLACPPSDAGASSSGGSGGSTTTTASATTAGGGATGGAGGAAKPAAKAGCGCSLASTAPGGATATLALILLGTTRRRRRP